MGGGAARAAFEPLGKPNHIKASLKKFKKSGATEVAPRVYFTGNLK
jgi:hypothetical protein